MISISTWQKCGHITFIILCLMILVIQYMPPFGMNRNEKVLTNHKSGQQALQGNLSNEKTLKSVTPEYLSDGQISDKKQPSPNIGSNSSKKNTAPGSGEGFADDLKELPFPEIRFIEPMLAGWDKEAEKLISEGNLEGLINLKMRTSAGMPPEVRANFLKSDCGVSLLNSSLGPNMKDNKSGYIYLQHYKASLEALHRVNANDPYYFLGTSILCLHEEKDKTKAMSAAQEGLNLLRSRENITAADVYYDWQLTQIASICLSTSNKNEEAIKVITECKKRAESLAENERGLVKEISAVIDSIQHGKTFSRMVPSVQSLMSSE